MFHLGIRSLILVVLAPQPGLGNEKDDYGGLLPAQQSFDGHIRDRGVKKLLKTTDQVVSKVYSDIARCLKWEDKPRVKKS